MNSVNTSQKISLEGYDLLENLALNLRSAWNHSADEIWQQLDPELWNLTHNPWAVLRTISEKSCYHF